MTIQLHANATTTPKTRRYIQQSKKTDKALAKELGISIDTVRRWRKRDDVHDRSHDIVKIRFVRRLLNRLNRTYHRRNNKDQSK
ncbi:MAG: hypothetical protein BA870_03440 [Desulfuromonadales bacterium C00003094]|jgi:hypothetical protein|nr:MAG: hypothetical protein BA870_03440 [Desulfuromonadales bacterium C00003094]OEU73527.1 MAG: hypothetical protein BA869_02755 [Desulfuromonadales bacterium C00003107]